MLGCELITVDVGLVVGVLLEEGSFESPPLPPHALNNITIAIV